MIRRSFHKPDVLCSADGCTMPIGKGKLFCKGHYFSLPKPLRDALWTAWRAAMDARRDFAPRVEQSRLNAVYQVAFQACCDHLRTTPPTSAMAMTTVAYEAGAPVQYVGGRRM